MVVNFEVFCNYFSKKILDKLWEFGERLESVNSVEFVQLKILNQAYALLVSVSETFITIGEICLKKNKAHY